MLYNGRLDIHIHIALDLTSLSCVYGKMGGLFFIQKQRKNSVTVCIFEVLDPYR